MGLGLFGLSKIDDLFDSKKKTVTQEPMLTKQQIQAQNALLTLANEGRVGNLNDDQVNLGNYDLVDSERTALSQLAQLLGSGAREELATSRNVLTDIANEGFNPDAMGFQNFKKIAAKELQDQNDILNREALLTGSRFNTGLLQEKRELQERNDNRLLATLSDLYNTARNRSLQASGGLQSLAGLSEGLDLGRIDAGLNLGTRERDLINQEAEVKYNDFLRKRNERLGSLSTLYNKNVPYGVKSTTVKSPSLFSQLAAPLLGAAGTAIGGPVGGAIGSSIGGMFNRQPSQPQQGNTQNFTQLLSLLAR